MIPSLISNTKIKQKNLVQKIKFTDREFSGVTWPLIIILVDGSWTIQRYLETLSDSFQYQRYVDITRILISILHLWFIISSNLYDINSIKKRLLAINTMWALTIFSTIVILLNNTFTRTEITKIPSLITYTWLSWRLKYEIIQRTQKETTINTYKTKFKIQFKNISKVFKYSGSEFIETLYAFLIISISGIWTVERFLRKIPEHFLNQRYIDLILILGAIIHMWLITNDNLQALKSLKQRLIISNLIWGWITGSTIMIIMGRGIIGVEVTKPVVFIVYTWISWRLKYEIIQRTIKKPPSPILPTQPTTKL